MADSFDDEEPRDGRSTFHRVVEALTVVALIAAVVIWQSDGTLDAARRFAAQLGFGASPSGNGSPPVEDTRFAASDLPRLDPTATGSIGSIADAPPLAISADEAPPLAPARPIVSAGWRAACDDGTPSFCTASQSLAIPDNPGLETSWTIEKGKDGVVAVWTTPTDVAIGRGMMLTLGKGTPKTVPFESCGPHSCEVRARLAADFLADLRKAGEAHTVIVLRDGRSVTFDFSPEGLAEALDKLGV